MSIKQLLALYILNLSLGSCYAMEPELNLVQASDLTTTAETQLKITTSDNQEITVNRNLMRLSPTVRSLLEDVGNVESIDLTLTVAQVNTIINFLPDLRAEKTEEIAAKVNKMEVSVLLEMVKAANYLALNDLLEIGLKAFAAKINSYKDIEQYVGEHILPQELMHKMLKLIGAINCFKYRSSFAKPLKMLCENGQTRSFLNDIYFVPGSENQLIISFGNHVYALNLDDKPDKIDIFRRDHPLFMSEKPIVYTSSKIATCLWENASSSEQLLISDIKNGKQTQKMATKDFLSPCGFTADETCLIASDKEYKISVLDIANDSVLRTFTKSGVPLLSHNGSLIFINPTISKDAYCGIYDTKTGNCVHEFTDIKKIKIAYFSPDDSVLVIESKNGIQLWDVKAQRYKYMVVSPAEEKWMSCLCFSGDSSLLAVGFYTGVIRVWDVITGKFIGSLPCNERDYYPKDLFFSSDNTALISNLTYSSQVRNNCVIWDLNAGVSICSFNNNPTFRFCGFNADHSLAVGHDKNAMAGWIWSINKNSFNDCTIDQSLLLICYFKAMQNDEKILMPKNKKLKAISDTIKGALSDFITDYNKRIESSKWSFCDETETTIERKKRKRL